MKFINILAVSFFILHPLFGDQFGYIKPELARKAEKLLKNEKDVYLFCEPCGEKKGHVLKISAVESGDVNYKGLFEVRIDDEGIDLAYTYIRRDGKWKNLAIELGLKPHGVTQEFPFSGPDTKAR